MIPELRQRIVELKIFQAALNNMPLTDPYLEDKRDNELHLMLTGLTGFVMIMSGLGYWAGNLLLQTESAQSPVDRNIGYGIVSISAMICIFSIGAGLCLYNEQNKLDKRIGNTQEIKIKKQQHENTSRHLAAISNSLIELIPNVARENTPWFNNKDADDVASARAGITTLIAYYEQLLARYTEAVYIPQACPEAHAYEFKEENGTPKPTLLMRFYVYLGTNMSTYLVTPLLNTNNTVHRGETETTISTSTLIL